MAADWDAQAGGMEGSWEQQGCAMLSESICIGHCYKRICDMVIALDYKINLYRGNIHIDKVWDTKPNLSLMMKPNNFPGEVFKLHCRLENCIFYIFPLCVPTNDSTLCMMRMLILFIFINECMGNTDLSHVGMPSKCIQFLLLHLRL